MTESLEVARGRKDEAILQLWSRLRDLSDFGPDALTYQDLYLFAQLTKHESIQRRLDD